MIQPIQQAYRLLRSRNTLISLLVFLLFILAPFLIYFDVLFLDYTISFNEAATDFSYRFGRLFPVADPTAGSLQDHPWLFKIGMALRQGSIPLINLENGLGALLAESLQSGVFYPLNLLLILMDLSSPQFFDCFSVLHVLILAINSFFLFRLYIRWELALILASAFALSPLSFSGINMVHYRAFVWTPLIAWAAVCAARKHPSLPTVLVGSAATVCCITAGNPQESFFDLLAVFLFFVGEIVHSRQARSRSIAIFTLFISGGVLISSPSFLPFFYSKSAGLLNSVENVARSSGLVNPQWLAGWLIPYINGPFPDLYRPALGGHDEYSIFPFHPLIVFLAISGIFTLVLNWKTTLPNRFLFITLLSTGLLGILAVSKLSPFQAIIPYLPFINTIRIAKYITYIHLLIGTSSVIALSWLIEMSSRARYKNVLYTSACLIALILIIVILEVIDPTWKFNWKRFDQVLLSWAGAIVAIAALIYFLLRRSKVGSQWPQLWIFVFIAALMMRPYGFYNSFQSHSPFPVSGLKFSQERILSNADGANTNLLRGYERVEVFDPILNKTFSTFMVNHFPIINGFYWLQLLPDSILTAKQVDILRLMGVTSTFGYKVEASSHIRRISDSFFRITDPLPQVFLLKSAEAIETACQKNDYTRALELMQGSILSRTKGEVRKGVNHLEFQLDQAGSGTLVSLQAFSPGWHFNEASPSKFCGIFNAWQGKFAADQAYQIRYTPMGLRQSYGFTVIGIAFVLAAVLLSRKSVASETDSQRF